MGIALAERPLSRFDDVRWSWKVGLADLEMHDVAALRFQLARLGQNLESGFGTDLIHPAREFHGIIL